MVVVAIFELLTADMAALLVRRGSEPHGVAGQAIDQEHLAQGARLC